MLTKVIGFPLAVLAFVGALLFYDFVKDAVMSVEEQLYRCAPAEVMVQAADGSLACVQATKPFLVETMGADRRAGGL